MTVYDFNERATLDCASITMWRYAQAAIAHKDDKKAAIAEHDTKKAVIAQHDPTGK